jgi:two-component system sensor histidine kinase KdpD
MVSPALSLRRDVAILAGGLIALAVLVLLYAGWLHVANPLIVGFSFLLVVLLAAASARFWVAAAISVVAMLAFNFFFLPPVRTFYLADPQNWVALFVFLVVSLVASNLSTAARTRAQEALQLAEERATLLEERRSSEIARRGEELKSALLASLAHNLRTPLTAIRIAASNLDAAWADATGRREQTDIILTEVDRLQRLFQNVLDMARIDAGGVSAELRWTHPSEIVEAAREQVGATLRSHALTLEVRSEAMLRLDPRLTAAALAHVLENAAQYSPSGSVVTVTVDTSDKDFSVTVRDRGPGIDTADLPHLFDRFYRGAAARQRIAGTGMGLAIARGLVTAQGGEIWAENCSDGGARFWLVIPAQRRVANAVESTA